ncbi:DeoR/GlpR family DNA-binding transcription regulator [Cohnella hashimotonis]|uniref:DeoR/GlpR family DNA-binding transcription regulator n=1 Tax=Cohnella hashimotonis TaxID=2826895 RepID=A0ABT6THK2_9BACL|nr:DeoR/GlpR family DNA-binding transcription regulator [Cohnella hashimotonis]MDI4645790.1 DeoR/GlpR family DNA-binding transcription regulator [Cohnella hashimotonis]
MLARERHNKIIQMLHRQQFVKANDLMKAFGVSFETIRRDLERLEKDSYLIRVHGGATLPDNEYRNEMPFTVREQEMKQEKRELATTASRFVTEGQSLILDVSTTNSEFAKVLCERFERLTIMTNSFPIANLLMNKPSFTIIFVGGVVRNSEQSVVGDFAEAFVGQFHADTFFMSTSGISLSEGMTDYGIGEIQLKAKMLQRSKKVIALADSSKFEVVSLYPVCALSDIDKIVTDSKVSPEIVRLYKEEGIEIVYS